MSKDITRKHFLHLSLGATAATLLACGDDTSDDGDSGTTDPTTTTSPTTTSPTTTSPTTTSPTTTTSDDTTTTDATTDPTTESTDPTTETTETTDPGDTTAADTGTTGSAGCVADPTIAIAGHPGHVLVVTLAEVEAGVEVVYDIMGASAHTHSVVITAEHFATLLATGQVIVDVPIDATGHGHTVTITCM